MQNHTTPTRRGRCAEIVDHYKTKIIAGEFQVHDPLPSIRNIAAAFSVNSNTAQRACHQLAEDGFLYSVHGKGMFVAPPNHYRGEKASKLERDLFRLVGELVYEGVPAARILQLVRSQLYGRGGKPE